MPLEFFLLMNFWPRGFYGNRAKQQEREDVSGDEDRPSLGTSPSPNTQRLTPPSGHRGQTLQSALQVKPSKALANSISLIC